MKRRRSPLWRQDRRRSFLVGLDYQAIYKEMNKPNVPRGYAETLAKRYHRTPGSILAIAAARAGLRYLGDLVQPLAMGLRRFNPKNREKALDTRGVTSQRVIYRRLRPKPPKQKGGTVHVKARATA